jgi:hypothetical protein
LNNRFTKKKKKTYGSKVSADFNPFDQGKNKIPKKKTKEELNMCDDNNNYSKNEELIKNEEIVNNYVNSNKNANYVNKQNNEEDEYLMKKQFYEKMLNEDNKEMDITNSSKNIMKQNSIKKPNVMNIDPYDGEELEDEIQNEEDIYKNEQILGCACCQSANNNDSKNRLKRKENPALLEPQEIR